MRCSWCDEKDAEYVAYHDNEWGVLVQNAKAFILIQKEFGSFGNYIWGKTSGKTLLAVSSVTRNDLSYAIAKDLSGRELLTTIYMITSTIATGIFIMDFSAMWQTSRSALLLLIRRYNKTPAVTHVLFLGKNIIC